MEKLKRKNIEVVFTTRFQQSLAEARAASSEVAEATMTFEANSLNGELTKMAVKYPAGIAQMEIDHFRDSIIRQIIMRKVKAQSVRVTGLTYAITHQQVGK